MNGSGAYHLYKKKPLPVAAEKFNLGKTRTFVFDLTEIAFLGKKRNPVLLYDYDKAQLVDVHSPDTPYESSQLKNIPDAKLNCSAPCLKV